MKRKIIIPITLIVIIVVTLILNYDNILTLRFNVAVKNNNCEKLYNLFNLENEKHLTKEKFVSQCKINLKNNKDYKANIKDHKLKNNIVKIYKNIEFIIPADSKFYLNDKLINDNKKTDDNNIYTTYKIDKLYEGDYNVKFENKTKEEKNVVTILNDDVIEKYEYNNEKQSVVVIGYDSCSYCKKLLNFINTLDSNIFNLKYYDIYHQDSTRITKDFYNYFNEEVKGYPTVVIGNIKKMGYSEELEKEYIESIYYSYRNEVKTVIE